MQIELIDTFLDLIETRSFNRTAERMGVTQSTVSGRLAALEKAIAARLFDRSRAGTQLTTEGLQFEPHARLIRQDWTQARRAVASKGAVALSLRLGIQNDLTQPHLGGLVAAFRDLLPQTAIYIEPDYSTQMCNDLVTGQLDLAVLFTPKPHPDLYFVSAGEIPYLLISSEADTRAALTPDRYVLANFSPAFEAAHRQLLPEFSTSLLSVGQSIAVTALLNETGGSGYVMRDQARDLLKGGRFHQVKDAPIIHQPVYSATHLRHRTSPVHRRLVSAVRQRFAV